MTQSNADLLNGMSISNDMLAEGRNPHSAKGSFPVVNTFGSFFNAEPPIFETWLEYMKLESTFVEQTVKFVKQNGKDKLFQPLSSINTFNRYISDFTGNDSEGVTIMILPLALDYLSHNLDNRTFIPDPIILSFVFHEIFMKDVASANNCPSQAFLLIKKSLRKFPPRDPQSRLYWLKVIMPYEYNSYDKKAPKKKLNVERMLDVLMDLVRRVGKEEEPIKENLYDFFLELFEVDLYLTEYQETTNTRLPEASTYHEDDKDFSTNKTISLLSQPLPYLLLDISGEISAFVPYALHPESKKFMYQLSTIVAENEEDMRYSRFAARLQLVFMEAVRFMRRHKETDQIHEYLVSDLRTALKKLVEHKVQKKTLLEFYPIVWAQSLIASLYPK